MVDHRLELRRLAALRDHDRDVAPGRHAEVAVDRLGQMEEGRGGPGRSESRGDLAPDVARLAEPADKDLTFARKDQPDRILKRRAESVGKGVQGTRLVINQAAP